MRHPRSLKALSGALCALTLGCASTQPELKKAEPPAAAAQPAAPPTPPALRLPDTVRPERYGLTLTLDPRQETFQGVEDVALVLTGPTARVWMHGKELTVSRAAFRTDGAGEVPARAVQGSEDFLLFEAERPLPAGRTSLHVEYTGKVSSKSTSGVFRQQDGGEWYLLTQFEADDARRAFPSFDEPGFKVPFQVTLKVPADQQAFTNTAPVAEQTADGWRTVRFAETKPLPAYLLAFAAGPYEVVDAGRAGQNQVPVRMVVQKGRAAEAAYAARTTGELLETLERYFGIPYPYEKLDTLVIPLSGYAMEHPGLITFSGQAMLARPGEETPSFRTGFATIQAHELAHQWFGNLVTPVWWDDTWLNESFATWMSRKAVEAWHPGWGVQASKLLGRETAMAADSLASARRIRQPIQSQGDIVHAFDGITYAKGAAVLEMFEASVGEERFRQGIRLHLQRHAHGTATAADFLASLGEAAGQDVVPAITSFLDQPGLPLVSVALSCQAGRPASLHLTQSRFLPVGSHGDGAQTWRVPVCVRYGKGTQAARACTELSGAEGTLALEGVQGCPTWVVPNAETKGYYRSRLEGDLLERLVREGRRQLTQRETVGLLADARALVAAGALPAADALALTSRVLPSEDPEVLSAAATVVGGVRPDFLPEAVRPAYARFVRKLFGGTLRKLGLAARPDEDPELGHLRPTLVELVALDGGDREVQRQATALALRWLEERKGVAPELVPVLLATAAHGGDAALHARLLQAAQETSERAERMRLLQGILGSRVGPLVEQGLALMLSGKVDAREVAFSLPLTPVEPTTREVAYRFVREHLDALVQVLPREMVPNLARVAGGFCDAAHRQEVEAFFGPRTAKYPGGDRVLTQTLERLDQCIAIRDAQRSSLQAFLARQ